MKEVKDCVNMFVVVERCLGLLLYRLWYVYIMFFVIYKKMFFKVLIIMLIKWGLYILNFLGFSKVGGVVFYIKVS